ncbi:MAG: Nif3-like dinuclear metal center hexameric protein [Deltaproteobacteria bacterium]|jgi:dinuclear metal center YbgI/SA1388 family protein|nr:Nif3-like dinuclear metal center hexameric protein [Deltaproteobacteria bacterium]
MKVSDLLDIIHRVAPSNLAAEWDNTGLQVGDPRWEVQRAALALDPTSKNIQKALDLNCQLLITHHPLIFRPFKKISPSDPAAAPVWLAVSKGLAVISVHTNWDAVGVAIELAELLALEVLRPLEDKPEPFSKLTVFVPQEHAAAVRLAAFQAGAGTIGDYPECFFQAPGMGGFTVPPWGKPFSGSPGKAHQAPEERLEIILPSGLKGQVDRAVRAVHPYEEPAIEFYEIQTLGSGYGLIGRWDPPRDAVAFLKNRLTSNGLWAGPIPDRISEVALMPGSGGDYVAQAAALGAELLITGDVGHHQALLACEAGLAVFSAGHFETERPAIKRLAQRLRAAMQSHGAQVELLILEESSPFRRF